MKILQSKEKNDIQKQWTPAYIQNLTCKQYCNSEVQILVSRKCRSVNFNLNVLKVQCHDIFLLRFFHQATPKRLPTILTTRDPDPWCVLHQGVVTPLVNSLPGSRDTPSMSNGTRSKRLTKRQKMKNIVTLSL